MYNIDYYDYFLPEERIAQKPLLQRDKSKLMILDRKTQTVEHKIFSDIEYFLEEGDLLVLNNTKVIPARLFGNKPTGAKIQVFLLEKISEENTWKALVKPGSKVKVGDSIIFSNDLKCDIRNVLDEGIREIKFSGSNIWETINTLGEVPLPHYIKESIDDPNRYQTKYAKIEGAVAAPTAGLHFTEDLLRKLALKGVNIEEVTLHVGLGTFRPVKAKDIRNHSMHEEFYSINDSTIKKIEDTKKRGKRVIAVGTTVVRTLESYAINKNNLSGKTNIFIYPPYDFKIVDGLITNFHLPKSSLIMLVSAFSNRDFILEAYKIAVEEKYRFFSFGDAMFIK